MYLNCVSDPDCLKFDSAKETGTIGKHGNLLAPHCGKERNAWSPFTAHSPAIPRFPSLPGCLLGFYYEIECHVPF